MKKLLLALTKPLLSLSAVLITLIVCELVIRLFYFGFDGVFHAWRYSPEPFGRRHALNKPNDDYRLPYELKPNVKTYFKCTPFSVNSDGLRDRDYSLEKREGGFRIIILEELFTQGSRVKQEDVFSEVIERSLKRICSDEIEVLNFGVGGYDTFYELQYLKKKGLKYSPDLVIIAFHNNDIKGAVKSVKRAESRTLIEAEKGSLFYRLRVNSFFYQWLRQRKFIVNLRKGVEEDPPSDSGRDERYDVIGDILSEFAELSKENGFQLLLVNISYLHKLDEKVEAICGKFNIPTLDIQPFFEGIGKDELWIYPIDFHPNAKGHKIYADVIVEYLLEQRIPTCRPTS